MACQCVLWNTGARRLLVRPAQQIPQISPAPPMPAGRKIVRPREPECSPADLQPPPAIAAPFSSAQWAPFANGPAWAICAAELPMFLDQPLALLFGVRAGKELNFSVHPARSRPRAA